MVEEESINFLTIHHDKSSASVTGLWPHCYLYTIRRSYVRPVFLWYQFIILTHTKILVLSI